MSEKELFQKMQNEFESFKSELVSSTADEIVSRAKFTHCMGVAYSNIFREGATFDADYLNVLNAMEKPLHKYAGYLVDCQGGPEGPYAELEDFITSDDLYHAVAEGLELTDAIRLREKIDSCHEDFVKEVAEANAEYILDIVDGIAAYERSYRALRSNLENDGLTTEAIMFLRNLEDPCEILARKVQDEYDRFPVDGKYINEFAESEIVSPDYSRERDGWSIPQWQ